MNKNNFKFQFLERQQDTIKNHGTFLELKEWKRVLNLLLSGEVWAVVFIALFILSIIAAFVMGARGGSLFMYHVAFAIMPFYAGACLAWYFFRWKISKDEKASLLRIIDREERLKIADELFNFVKIASKTKALQRSNYHRASLEAIAIELICEDTDDSDKAVIKILGHEYASCLRWIEDEINNLRYGSEARQYLEERYAYSEDVFDMVEFKLENQHTFKMEINDRILSTKELEALKAQQAQLIADYEKFTRQAT